jgi:N-acetylglucosaminyldiphosphoundecaprenol N-acetyl-beta-D-mannosaminyltransferase
MNVDMDQLKRVEILGVPFLNETFAGTVELLTRKIEKGEKFQVVTANPEIVMMSKDHPYLLKILQNAEIVTPDGIGIVMASRWMGQPLPERVTGYELLHGLMSRANEKGWKYVLVGASPSSCQGAAEKLQRLYPNAQCAGFFDGYFSPETEIEIIESIRQAKPHLLFVGLGAPKQEEWIAKHLPDLPVHLVMGVGGSFDVLSGLVKRAPKIWQKLNIEWLYRLLSQPKRWRRQLMLPRFALIVLWNLFLPQKK